MNLKGYSTLTGELLDLGPSTADDDALLELGSMAATGHDNLIVFAEGPLLQKWEATDE